MNLFAKGHLSIEPRITQILLLLGVVIYFIQKDLGDSIFGLYNGMSDSIMVEILLFIAGAASVLLSIHRIIVKKRRNSEKVIHAARAIAVSYFTEWTFAIADIMMLLVLYAGDLQLLILYSVFYFPFISLMSAYNEKYILEDGDILKDSHRFKRLSLVKKDYRDYS